MGFVIYTSANYKEKSDFNISENFDLSFAVRIENAGIIVWAYIFINDSGDLSQHVTTYKNHNIEI